ncbi:oleoyl-acyl carrier protein thioesterase 2 chloroplastic [Phtheirospermum japonicum]|uniref:Acyl-[acyl-carrier-protein] hydrolase n=1 Tax=Phtheirospermum japonicum TaxID=374723 RepID=A0A830BZ47_9LAMI|nr:oleoyl-acyl carrier protein thioesterase 2 chloroplastic [Phtheirospermum japonicum]
MLPQNLSLPLVSADSYSTNQNLRPVSYGISASTIADGNPSVVAGNLASSHTLLQQPPAVFTTTPLPVALPQTDSKSASHMTVGLSSQISDTAHSPVSVRTTPFFFFPPLPSKSSDLITAPISFGSLPAARVSLASQVNATVTPSLPELNSVPKINPDIYSLSLAGDFLPKFTVTRADPIPYFSKFTDCVSADLAFKNHSTHSPAQQHNTRMDFNNPSNILSTAQDASKAQQTSQLDRGAFPASHIATAAESRRGCLFPSLSKLSVARRSSLSPPRPFPVMSVATGEPKSWSHKPRAADQLRLGGMAEDGVSYKEKFIVRSYEVGMNKTITIQIVANFLQDVACNHFLSGGYSTEDGFSTIHSMKNLNLILVMSRIHIEVYKYPAWNDVVEIETWFQIEGRIGFRRDWTLKDYSTGEVIGRATRLAFPDENKAWRKKIEKLDDPPQYSKLGLEPGRGDLDMNRHVNNVTYIGWLLESIPSEVVFNNELHSLTIDYRRECQHGDIVDSLTSPESDEAGPQHQNGCTPCDKRDENGHLQFRHLLRLSGNGAETNRARTVWRRKVNNK